MIVMKKELLIMLVSIVLILFLLLCIIPPNHDTLLTDKNLNQKENCMEDFYRPEFAYQPELGDIFVYDLDREEFQEFLTEPSIDFAREKCYCFSIYRKSGNYVEVEVFDLDGTTKTEGTYFWLFPLRVNIKFINFLNDPENIIQILSEHGIDDEILSYVIISHSTYSSQNDDQPIPPGNYPQICIWIHTDIGDYFLSRPTNKDDSDLTYDFYDLAGYSNKYGTS